SAQIREILISESAWEEMTCLFAPSLAWENFRFPSGPLKRTPYSTIIFDIQTAPNYISSLWQQRSYISIAAVATIFWLFTKTI
ncbi:hypothetical protein ACH668_00310, partial [Klebsiella pneumoniae]|nr:hypothetical protein [Klebsiella pneumoniae]